MDPDIALNQVRAALATMDAETGKMGNKSMAEYILAAGIMKDAFTDLDGWLSLGGQLPRAWDRS